VILFPETTTSSPAPIAALTVELWDEAAFGLPPDVLARLGGGMVVLHVPIDPRPRSQKHAVSKPRRSRRHRGRRTVGSRAARGVAREILVAAALREEIDPCVDEVTRNLLGRSP